MKAIDVVMIQPSRLCFIFLESEGSAGCDEREWGKTRLTPI